MSKVIGIDLGTTFSCVSFMENGTAKVIPNAEGNNVTASVVAFGEDGEILVGDAAKRQSVTNPESTFYAIKRLIGRRFKDADVQKMAEKVPFKIVAGPNGDAWVEAHGKQYAPAQISAMILQEMKKTAETYLGEEITQAVITVPAYFNDAQRQATKDAGQIAGLEVLRIVNEPTAAALSYGLGGEKEGTFAIYDLGGGTFDISILEIEDGVFTVKSTNGDTFLGGEDFDGRIVEYLLEEFGEQNDGMDLSGDKVALQRLKEAAENAKIALSAAPQTQINLPFLAVSESGPKHLDLKLTRAKFEDLVKDLIQRTIKPVEDALKDAGLKPSDIDKVIMVGGMTRVQKVNEAVAALFGKDKLEKGVHPDEVVGTGAAIQAAVLTGDIDDVLLLDVTPLSIGLETAGGVMTTLIPRNTTIPTEFSETFTTAKDGQKSVGICIFQGERAKAKNNKLLGEFSLDKIAPAPAGIPQITVTFNVNADGILDVTAMDEMTKRKQHITVTANGGLSEEQVESMLQDAEENAEADLELRNMVTAKNVAESTVNYTADFLEEYADNLPAAEKATVETLLAELKECVADGNVDSQTIEAKADELSKANMDAGKAMYEQAQAEAEAQAADAAADDEPTADDDEAEETVEVVEEDVVVEEEPVSQPSSAPNPSP